MKIDRVDAIALIDAYDELIASDVKLAFRDVLADMVADDDGGCSLDVMFGDVMGELHELVTLRTDERSQVVERLMAVEMPGGSHENLSAIARAVLPEETCWTVSACERLRDTLVALISGHCEG